MMVAPQPHYEEGPVNTFGDRSGMQKSPGGSKYDNKKKKSPREKNPKFRDVEETGQWGGDVSRKEKVIILLACLLIIGGIAAGAGVALSRTPDPIPVSTRSPTPAPTFMGIDKRLEVIEGAINQNEQTFPLLEDLPVTASSFETMNTPESSPQQRAMHWSLYQDSYRGSDELVSRWVLAALYFQWGGDDWGSRNNWFTERSICDWEFVDCDPISNELRELDFTENNLVGTIPVELSLLVELKSLWLSNNQIQGTIPGVMLSTLPELGILYLDRNELTGTIPAALQANGVMNTVFVQQNNITGAFPAEFCPPETTTVDQFGIDCDKVECPPECCTPYNCYFSN